MLPTSEFCEMKNNMGFQATENLDCNIIFPRFLSFEHRTRLMECSKISIKDLLTSESHCYGWPTNFVFIIKLCWQFILWMSDQFGLVFTSKGN